MKHLLAIFASCLLAASSGAQTLKTVMTDTNGIQSGFFGAGAQTNLSLKVGATNSGFFSSISGLNVVRGGNVIWTAGTTTINFVVPFAFTGTNATANAATARTNLSLGATWLTNDNVTNFRTAIGLGATNAVHDAIETDNITLNGDANGLQFTTPTSGSGAIGATRSNLGLGLPALTNTSNVTMMRALAGSTNTNEPFSGIIQYADSPTGDIYEMTVSNGIILKTEMQ